MRRVFNSEFMCLESIYGVEPSIVPLQGTAFPVSPMDKNWSHVWDLNPVA